MMSSPPPTSSHSELKVLLNFIFKRVKASKIKSGSTFKNISLTSIVPHALWPLYFGPGSQDFGPGLFHTNTLHSLPTSEKCPSLTPNTVPTFPAGFQENSYYSGEGEKKEEENTFLQTERGKGTNF